MINLISKYRSELMGVCIIWIMLFHSQIDAPSNTALRALWYIFVSFGGGGGVDIFFFLSGFGLIYSFNKNRETFQIKNYFRKRLIRIIPAYLLIAVPYYFTTCNSFSEVCYNLFFLNFIIDGIRDFWYIFAILVFYSVFPAYAKLSQKCNKAFGLLIACVINQFLCMLVNEINPMCYDHWEIMLQRFPIFLIGIYVGSLFSEPDKKKYQSWILLATCILIGSCLLFLPISFLGVSRWIFTVWTFPVISMIVGLLFIVSVYIYTLTRFLSWCGKRSLELYLAHVSFGVMLLNIINNKPIALASYFCVSLLIAYVVFKFTQVFKNYYDSKHHSARI